MTYICMYMNCISICLGNVSISKCMNFLLNCMHSASWMHVFWNTIWNAKTHRVWSDWRLENRPSGSIEELRDLHTGRWMLRERACVVRLCWNTLSHHMTTIFFWTFPSSAFQNRNTVQYLEKLETLQSFEWLKISEQPSWQWVNIAQLPAQVQGQYPTKLQGSWGSPKKLPGFFLIQNNLQDKA